MNPTLLVAIGLIAGCVVGAATAVVAQSESPPRPSDYQNGSTCDAKAVKSYLAATDPTKRVDQDWNLKAAQAYEELAAMGFQEC